MTADRRAALFDMDGTLVDSTYLHAVTWWEAFRQAGHRVPMAGVHRTVGMGADHLIGHLLGPDRDPAHDAAVSSAHKTLFAEYWTRLVPLDGAADLLRACARRGWEVVLASSAGGAELSAMRAASVILTSGGRKAMSPALPPLAGLTKADVAAY